MLRIYRTQCCNLNNPIGLENRTPEFSWCLESDRYNESQESYQIVVEEMSGPVVWDSGVVLSEQTAHIVYEGMPLSSGKRYLWMVTVKSAQREVSSSSKNSFELGLLPSEWKAKWIAPVQNTNVTAIEDVEKPLLFEMFAGVDDDKETEEMQINPVSMLRRDFIVSGEVRSARLYITAHGLYEAYINGKAVTDTFLNPGFSTYPKYLDYQTYDITDVLENENILTVRLGEGWYKGCYGILGFNANYGKQIELLYQLEITYTDGKKDCIISDKKTLSGFGGIEYSDLLIGEKYDSTREAEEWYQGTLPDGLVACTEVGNDYSALKGRVSNPISVLMKRSVKVIKTPKGETILDVGQTMFGFINMTVSGCAGAKVTLEYTETLDHEGNFMNNISGYHRHQTDVYILNGSGEEHYHPTFTGHGFRYVRVSGYPGEVKAENFEGWVLGTWCEPTGTFSCSNPKLNQLQSNIQWSQRSNFVSIPTDCPQRERAGWTGDVKIYCSTASYNADTLAFYRRWLANVRAEQYEDGLVPIVVPWASGYRYIQLDMFGSDTSAGWGDVIMELPWTLYNQYGDLAILKENFPAMLKWMQYVEKSAEEGIPENLPDDCSQERLERQKYLWNTGFHYGDWLYPSCKNENGETDMFGSSVKTRELVATAVYVQSCEIMQKTCALLGEAKLEQKYKNLAKNIREAYDIEYVSEDGHVRNDLQGLYVLTLAMKMTTPEKAKMVAARLVELIHENGDMLDTGFMSVKYLMDVLVEYGYSEVAKSVLYNEGCPGWLYEINQGATSIWETWDAIRPDDFRTKVSYNHYSFGCIGDWMYRTLLGLQRNKPGYQKFSFAPDFRYNLTHAEGSLQTTYGKISAAWHLNEGNRCYYTLNIPVGTTADVYFPGLTGNAVTVNNKVTDSVASDAGSYLRLNSGNYEITYNRG